MEHRLQLNEQFAKLQHMIVDLRASLDPKRPGDAAAKEQLTKVMDIIEKAWRAACIPQ